MAELAGKVAIITGASSGIGAACARAMAAEGAKVVLAARREDKSAAVLEEIKAAGGEGVFVKTDVNVRDDLEALVAKTLETYGRLDAAVNNAGVSGKAFTPAGEISEDDWDWVLNTNLRAVWMSLKFQAPAILESGGGSIVNISSIYGLKGSEIGHAHYAASKHGVIGLTKSAAMDYGDKGLRVNAVCPGFTVSEMIDPTVDDLKPFFDKIVERHSASGRLGESEEIAQTVSWLCSDRSSFVNGVALPVDGGPTSRLY